METECRTKQRLNRLKRRALACFFALAAVAAALLLAVGLDRLTREQTLEQPETPSGAESFWPENRYDRALFTEENGRVVYTGGPYETGIDVSSHQEEIDWAAVKASGISYAMIRVGYRGYTEGFLTEDARFRENIQGALDAGLSVGVYFFSQAISAEEAMEEAAFVLERIQDYAVTCPVVFDWESVESAARTDGMDTRTVALCAETFCLAVEEQGFTPGVYFNQGLGYSLLQDFQRENCVLWLAQYDSAPSFLYSVNMWQYTNQGTVPGINGPVDLNLRFLE